MGISIQKVIKSMWHSAFPTSTNDDAPESGPGAGDSSNSPKKNVDKMGKALELPMILAGTSAVSFAQHFHIASFDVSTDPAVYESATSDDVSVLVGVRATKRYRLSRVYGGCAWRPDDGLIYLVPQDNPSPTGTSRMLYKFDLTATPHEISSGITLLATDDAAWRGVLGNLVFLSGRWHGFMSIVPPISHGPATDPTMHQIGIWEAGGAADTPHPTWEDALPSAADRVKLGGHEFAFTSRRNGLIIWRVGVPSAWYARSFVTLRDDSRPAEFDWDPNADDLFLPTRYLVMWTGAGEVRWWDVGSWDAAAGAHYSDWKRIYPMDSAGRIQDLTIDRANNRLWILTTSKELQRYDLPPFAPVGEGWNDNDPKSLVPILIPTVVQVGSIHSIVFLLLDAWGRPTSRSGATVEVSLGNASGSLTFDMQTGIKVDAVSTLGLVLVEYVPDAASVGIEETVVARILE